MNTSFWNLFSPKRTPDKTPPDADDASSDRPQPQRQPQRDGVARDVCDDSAEKPAIDALSLFFHGPPSASSPTIAPSYAQWREGRKRFLVRYFEHRLVGVDDDADNDPSSDHHDDDDDEGSFDSEVLDDDFDDDHPHGHPSESTRDLRARHSNHAPPERDGREPSDSPQEANLETQPQTPPVSVATMSHSHRAAPVKSSSSEKTSSLSLGRKRSVGTVWLSGIKRKLGFSTQRDDDAEHDNKGAPDENASHHDDLPVARPAKRRHRGRMWNADFASVPHVRDAVQPVARWSELDLDTATLDLKLCKILRIWKCRHTKRMEKRRRLLSPPCENASQQEDDDDWSRTCMDPSAASNSTHHEDDGPLNTVYRRVLSMELASLEEDEEPPPASPSHSPRASDLAAAAFPRGSERLQRAAERKRRHAARRGRVFFYDGYAEALSRALDDVDTRTNGKRDRGGWLSLANVPAHCILPRTFARGSRCSSRLRRYVDHPFGDEEYGVPSTYCVCIGDASTLKLGSEKLCFDSEELEIRLAAAPGSDAAVDVTGTAVEAGDVVVTSETVRSSGLGYVREEGSSVLKERYWNVRGAAAASGERRGGMTFLVGDEDTVHARAPAEKTIVAGVASEDVHREESANDNYASQDSSKAGEGTRSGEVTGTAENGTIARPHSVKPLSSMLPLLSENGMKRLKDPVTVYGVVLGFSPPSLTTTKEWKMSMVLIDESLPISIEPLDRQQSGGCPPSSNTESSSKEVHVPSITLVLFVKNKIHLPVVCSAGDVVCCRNVILQGYNHEPQLLCNRKSSVVVVRPARVRSPGVELHDSASPKDWSLSCSCHENDGHDAHPYIHWLLSNNLWRWGQQRLASHPTMSPNCKISIAGLDEPTDTLESSVSGDLTAAITAIIPHPEHLRRRDTPRGYIRLWDGTGPPRSDPLPPDVMVDSNLSHDDPPEKVLVEIENMLNAIASNGASNPICVGVDAPISLTGRVINATIWEEELWQLIQREKIIHVGSFIRLRNINNAKLLSGINCLSVHVRSSVTPLPFDSYEVQLLLKEHDTRIKRGSTTNPSSGILPGSSRRTETKSVATTQAPLPSPTLNECIRRAVPSTFAALFQISRTIPPFNPSSNNAIKNLCCKNKDGSVGFRFAFHIFDDTAEMDVLCLGAVAEKIIKEKAQDIMESNNVRMRSLGRLNELMTPGYIFEGEIRSMLGRDNKVYYILKSMVCVQANV